MTRQCLKTCIVLFHDLALVHSSSYEDQITWSDNVMMVPESTTDKMEIQVHQKLVVHKETKEG